MDVDVVVQSLDAVAFVLVTPEFLGEDRLKAIHARRPQQIDDFESFYKALKTLFFQRELGLGRARAMAGGFVYLDYLARNTRRLISTRSKRFLSAVDIHGSPGCSIYNTDFSSSIRTVCAPRLLDCYQGSLVYLRMLSVLFISINCNIVAFIGRVLVLDPYADRVLRNSRIPHQVRP